MICSEIISELTYISYVTQREEAPDITPERWARIYGKSVNFMETRYQAERRVYQENTSKRYAEAYQNGQRDFDKAINPRLYNHMIGPNGQELMVEKYQIPVDWQT